MSVLPTDQSKQSSSAAKHTEGRWILPAICLLGLSLLGGVFYLGHLAMHDGGGESERDPNNPVTFELPEAYPRGDQPAAEIALIDQQGVQRSLSAMRGNPVIVSFAFAHCTTMCPGVIQTLKSVHKEVSDKSVKSLVVTIDPVRDTPSTLASTTSKWQFTPEMYFLSGDPSRVNTVLADYKVPVVEDSTSIDGLNHPALVYVVDPQGKIAYSFSNPTKRWLVDAIKRLSQTKSTAGEMH